MRAAKEETAGGQLCTNPITLEKNQYQNWWGVGVCGGGSAEPASVILGTSKGCRKKSGDLQRDAEEKEGGNLPPPRPDNTHNHFERAQSDEEEAVEEGEGEEERQPSVTLSGPETQQLPLSGRRAIRQRPDLGLM